MWGFALWALSHIVARGDAAAVIFFGTFVVLAMSGTWLIDRRKAATLGDDWRRFAAVTSNVPFAAIAGWPQPVSSLARNRLVENCARTRPCTSSCSCFITASSARTRSCDAGAAPAAARRG